MDKREIAVIGDLFMRPEAFVEALKPIVGETRLIRAGHEGLRQGQWRGDLYRADRTGSELSEMTVGLIGYGLIGTRVVKLLKPFGCRIIVCDPYQELSTQDRAEGVAM